MDKSSPSTSPADSFDLVVAAWKREMPGVDLSALSMSVRIGRLAALFNRAIDELVRPYGFGYGELEVLFFLLMAEKGEGMRPSDLTRGCFVTSGAITGRVDRLVKLNLVSRIPSLVDRREMIIRLTRDGEKLAKRLRAIAAGETALSNALAKLPENRRTQLGEDLRTILIEVENAIDRDHEPLLRPHRRRG